MAISKILNKDMGIAWEKYREWLGSETSRGLISEKDVFFQSKSPIFYEEIYRNYEPANESECKSENIQKESNRQETTFSNLDEQIHDVFLIHGYIGKAIDMQKLANMLILRWPKIRPVIWKSIEKYSQDLTFDIKLLGNKISKEICEEITTYPELSPSLKISFICHSLGGLLIRSALTKLRKLK